MPEQVGNLSYERKPMIARRLSRRTFLRSAGAMSLGLAGPLRAQEKGAGIDAAKLQDVKDFLDRELQAGSFPGAAVVASWKGKTVLEHFTGTYHNLLGEDKPYRSGVMSLFFSFSKGISATVVMMAHQDGLIDIDEPVAKALPEFAAKGKEKVTIRHILSHSAGIPNAPSPFKSLRDETEWKAAIQAICEAKLDFAPGSMTAYHAYALMVPAEIVRRKSANASWDAICREKLFDPLGAKSLTFDVSKEKSLVCIAPADTKLADGSQRLLPGHPAGGCCGTLDDALKVLQLHLANGVWNGKPLLKPETVKQMHTLQFEREIAAAVAKKQTPKSDFWGLGWLLRGEGPPQGAAWFGFRDAKSPRVFGHAGIDTIIGVADPSKDIALMFHTTRSPKSSAETVRLRNEVTNRVLAAVGG
jgi:CubicO group peptidase (beta-lactamase class C family)